MSVYSEHLPCLLPFSGAKVECLIYDKLHIFVSTRDIPLVDEDLDKHLLVQEMSDNGVCYMRQFLGN